jgi:hypothetical protein
MDFIQTAQEILSIKQNYVHYLDHEKLKEQHIKRVYDDDFDVYIFEQTWGNTSGGFEGVGGSAMTNQTTYILIPKFEHDCLVFFGGRFAYKAPCNQKFIEDVIKGSVRGKSGSGYYRKQD